MTELTLRIDGMHCGACIRRVSQALAAAPGVKVEEVRIGAARVNADNSDAAVEAALAAVHKAGYTARLDQSMER